MARMTYLFRGAEDMHFAPIGAPIVDTTSGHFRNGFARCAVAANNSYAPDGTARMASPITQSWRIPSSYGIAISQFWFSARIFNYGADNIDFNGILWQALSAGDVPRLQLRRFGNTLPTNTYQLLKVDNAGNVTLLATTTGAMATGLLTKLDFDILYAVSGHINIYTDGSLLISFAGDTTTNGNTTITGMDLCSWGAGTVFIPAYTAWSEVIWDTSDTRSMGLVTLAPGGLGNLDQWSGTFTDVNEITLNDLTANFSATANQEQLYTGNSMPAGTYAVLDVTTTGRAATGGGAPSHFDFEIVTHATTYVSGTQTPGNSFSLQSAPWLTNPNTGVAWTITELNVLQQGMKSIT
jgi:hypothetical protein